MRVLAGPVESEADLPAFCGKCGRAMKRDAGPRRFDRFTGHRLDGIPGARCPKFDGRSTAHEAFVVMPMPDFTKL